MLPKSTTITNFTWRHLRKDEILGMLETLVCFSTRSSAFSQEADGFGEIGLGTSEGEEGETGEGTNAVMIWPVYGYDMARLYSTLIL